jgi:hypothetical protein
LAGPTRAASMMATGTRQERRRQAPPNEQRRNHRHNTSAIDEDRDAESNTPEGALPAVAVEPETDSSILRYRDIPPELADAVREIINRYELRTRERVPKSIAVTSAMRGEGVTTVSHAGVGDLDRPRDREFRVLGGLPVVGGRGRPCSSKRSTEPPGDPGRPITNNVSLSVLAGASAAGDAFPWAGAGVETQHYCSVSGVRAFARSFG